MHVFFEDIATAARRLSWTAGGFLGVVLLILWGTISDTDDAGPSTELIISLSILLAILAIATWALSKRARKNTPFIGLGPSGVCFPANDIGPVGWEDITNVRLVRTTIRGGARFSYLRFTFRPGVVTRRQFGSLNKNQWEFMIANGSALFGETSRILGGTEALLECVARFHPIEGL